MCGIAGILKREGCPSVSRLESMAAVMNHRGPDHLATHSMDQFGCAHNRLSLLDPSARSHQPFVGPRGVLAYNGEIYNFAELRSSLDEHCDLRGTSDTSVLYALLVRDGVEKTVARLRGMFAFAFWDPIESRLYLVRDRLAIKPLFYTRRGSELFFASEVKALAAVCECRPDPIKALFAVAGHGDHSHRETVFRNVFHVPAGHFLVTTPGGEPKMVRYHSLDDEIDEQTYRELDGLATEAVTERFDALIEKSVRSMLIADAPVGAFVSGGIDSSLISAVARDHQPSLDLFTADVRGQYSELCDAQRLSKHLQLPLHAAAFDPTDWLIHWARTTWHYEAPLVTHTNAAPFMRVADLAAAHGMKAVLTGEGSDELFLGYPKLLAARYQKALRLPVDFIQKLYGVVPKLRSFLFPNPGDSIYGFLGLLTQSFERQRMREEGVRRYAFLGEEKARSHYRTIQMLREGIVALLHRNDRVGMAASIESRFPFLDEDVVRFAINLPERFKLGRTRRLHNWKHPFLIDKAIVRRSSENRLPKDLVHKRKNGFPMYGHLHLKIDEGMFQGGYTADLLQMSRATVSWMTEHANPYFVAKMASLEVFGQIYDQDRSLDEVTDFILASVHMKAPGQQPATRPEPRDPVASPQGADEELSTARA